MANENIRISADMSSFDKSMENSAKKAEKSFDDIVNAVKTTDTNVKKELRQLTNAMTSMLANGVDPASKEFQQLAQRAGALQDAIGDVREEIAAQANDTRNMTLAFGALSDGLNIFRTAQASLSLFGIESEDATKAIQKMMAAEQVLNSVQAISNSLTSKSTLLGKAYAAVKNMISVGAGAQAATEGTAAVATTGLAAAEGTATVATTAFSVALNSLPFVALISAVGVLVLGLVELAKSLISSTEEAKANKAAIESMTEANQKAAQTYMESSLEVEKYRVQVEKFVGTAGQEKKLIDELNKKYGEWMGLHESLHDWKRALIVQGKYYCEMLEEEAKAQALAAKMGELYAQTVTGELDQQSYNAQVAKIRKAWEDTLATVAAYKNVLRQPETLKEPPKPKPTAKTPRAGGTSRSITDDLHTIEQIDRTIATLQHRIASETDLAKKYDLSQQLKQVQSFKESVMSIDPMRAPTVDGASLAGLGLPEPAALQGRLDSLDELLAEWTQAEVERITEMREAFEEFKEGLSGDMGSIVEDFAMLAKMYEDNGISATEAAAGLVVLGNSLKAIGNNGPIAKAGATLAAIGQIILGFAQASAMASKLGPFGWLAFVGAGLGAVATTIATIQSYNTGGIVTGAGTTDTVPAMLTPGEAVLTRNDQARLWRMLKNGGEGAGPAEVSFVIRGSDLVGMMRNYNNTYGKVE